MYNASMITSVQNEFIKYLKKLKQEKEILCLDNPKLIDEAIKNNWEILNLIKSDGINKQYTQNDVVVSNNILKIFSNTKTSQQVIAFVKLKKQSLKPPSNNFLVLDNIQDPGNVGTLIRSAVGANFLDVYLINCASVTNDKTIRSTMGAIFKCNIFEVDREFIKTLKTWNKQIYIADMNGKNLYESVFLNNIGIVIGNEGHGVCQDLKKIAIDKISLPMKNQLESLNAGVSGSIIMYHITYGSGGKNVRS